MYTNKFLKVSIIEHRIARMDRKHTDRSFSEANKLNGRHIIFFVFGLFSLNLLVYDIISAF
jgi:hypothetical protein